MLSLRTNRTLIHLNSKQWRIPRARHDAGPRYETILCSAKGYILWKEVAIELHGNIQGLSQLQKRRLLNLYRKKIEADTVISFDRTRNMMEISREISRQI